MRVGRSVWLCRDHKTNTLFYPTLAKKLPYHIWVILTALEVLHRRGLVSFPDPAFKLDKGLAHFARNLGLPDLASHVIINVFMIVGGVWS